MMYSVVNSSQGKSDFVSVQEISKSLLNVSGKSGSFIFRLLQNTYIAVLTEKFWF